jgi:hypothetical protein
MGEIFKRVLNELTGADFWIALGFLAAGYVCWLWIGTTAADKKKVLRRQIGMALLLALLAGALISGNHFFFLREHTRQQRPRRATPVRLKPQAQARQVTQIQKKVIPATSPATESEQSKASVSPSPSLNAETPEWRRRIKPQGVESVESAEALALAFNSARLAAGPRGAGEWDDTKDLSTAIECLKPQNRPFKEKDLLGKWRCRSILVDNRLVVAYPFFDCRLIRKNGKLFFEKTTGSQRRSGYLYPSTGDHMVFLGSLTMNDDFNSGEYTDTVGVLVRKGSDRFLLILDATLKGYEIYEIVK